MQQHPWRCVQDMIEGPVGRTTGSGLWPDRWQLRPDAFPDDDSIWPSPDPWGVIHLNEREQEISNFRGGTGHGPGSRRTRGPDGATGRGRV